MNGQGSQETGGSVADRIFFMEYPMSFLQHWYTTYPPPHQDTTTTGSSVVSPSSAGVDVDMTGDNTSALTDSNFPHIPQRKAVVFNYYALVSDDLITSGPHSGHYTATFKCNIEDEAGKVCGDERSLLHITDNFKSVVSTKKYRIRAWFKCICPNNPAWMLRKCCSVSTSPWKLCT